MIRTYKPGCQLLTVLVATEQGGRSNRPADGQVPIRWYSDPAGLLIAVWASTSKEGIDRGCDSDVD